MKKRNFQPINSGVKPLHSRDVAEVLSEIAPNCIVHTAIVINRDIIPTSPSNCMSIDEILHVSKCKEDFVAQYFYSHGPKHDIPN